MWQADWNVHDCEISVLASELAGCRVISIRTGHFASGNQLWLGLSPTLHFCLPIASAQAWYGGCKQVGKEVGAGGVTRCLTPFTRQRSLDLSFAAGDKSLRLRHDAAARPPWSVPGKNSSIIVWHLGNCPVCPCSPPHPHVPFLLFPLSFQVCSRLPEMVQIHKPPPTY